MSYELKPCPFCGGYGFACSECGFCCDVPGARYCPGCGAEVVAE